MSVLLNRFVREERGLAATELALVTPLFLLMFLSATELGNMIYYSITVEKGMRSAITYAARNQVPLSDDAKDNIVSLTRTGTMDPNAPLLVRGYAEPEASVTVTTQNYTKTMSGQSEDIDVEVIILTVDVPYVPLLPFVTEKFIGTFDPTIKLTHMQAIFGD